MAGGAQSGTTEGYEDPSSPPAGRPPLRQWLWALGATFLVAPWLTPGGVVAVVLGVFMSPSLKGFFDGILLIGALIYTWFGVPDLVATLLFATVYWCNGREISRTRYLAVGVVLGFAAVFAHEAIIGPRSFAHVSPFFLLCGASAGGFGSVLFMWIVGYPDVEDHAHE